MNMTRLPFAVVFFLLLPMASQAQQGIVYYDFIEKREYDLPKEAEDMASLQEIFALFPEGRDAFILRFNTEASLMEKDQEYADSLDAAFEAELLRSADGIDIDMGQFAMELQAMMTRLSIAEAVMPAKIELGADDINLEKQSPVLVTYTSFADETCLQVREILRRPFRVTSVCESFSWNLTAEERSFQGYRILKATTVRDSVEVEAWYTPEIPVSAGPDRYRGLPGLVLILSLDDGRYTYTARKVSMGVAPEITPPAEGEEVTLEEFERIALEKFQERYDRLRSQIRDMGN